MPSPNSPLHLTATVRGGQLVLEAPLALADGAMLRVVAWTVEAGEAPAEAERVEVRLGLELARSLGDAAVEHVRSLRRSIENAHGVRIPVLRLCDDLGLAPEAWSITLDQRVLAQGRVHVGRWMVVSADERPLPEVGIPDTDPSFGMPVRWVTREERARVPGPGFIHVDPFSVITTALGERLLPQLPLLYGFPQLEEQLAAQPPEVLRALGELGVGRVRLMGVLRRLLAEGRSLVPFAGIVDAALLAWQQATGKDAAAADEACITVLLARFPPIEPEPPAATSR